jgi:DNA-binding response OmpR family regulator
MMRVLNLLIVDDEPDQLKLTKLYLQRNDPCLTIQTAYTASEALTKTEETEYDCIILDYVMPDTSGIQLAEKIRKSRKTPIILYTAKGSEGLASQSTDYGVDNYMMKSSKPEHFRTLAKRIRALADRYLLEQLGKAEHEYTVTHPLAFPKTMVEERAIYIVNEDGSRENWTVEETEEQARLKAKEIESILNDIKQKRNYLSRLIRDLTEMEVPAEYRKDLVKRSYEDLKEQLNKLNQTKTYQNS